MSEWKDGRRDYGDGWVGYTYTKLGRHLLHLQGTGQACFVYTTPETGEADCDALHAFLVRPKPAGRTVRAEFTATTADNGAWWLVGSGCEPVPVGGQQRKQRVVVDLLLPEPLPVVVGRVEESEFDHPTDPQTTHDAGKALDGVLNSKE